MKRCSKCGAEKPLEEFAPRNDRPSGRQSHCRVCQNTKARTPEGKVIKKRYEEKGGAVRKSSWRNNNPKKQYAHEQVRYAITTGVLVRSECEICGEKAEAHHDDYDKPLVVRWLCALHHKAWHKEHGEAPNGK